MSRKKFPLSLEKGVSARIHPKGLELLVPCQISWSAIVSLAQHIDTDVRRNNLPLSPRPASERLLLRTTVKAARAGKFEVEIYPSELVIFKGGGRPLRLPFLYVLGHRRTGLTEALGMFDR